jgi:large subunit ribosomal protein L18
MAAQLINDEAGTTVVAVHSRNLAQQTGTPVERAKALGLALGEKAKAAGITSVVFDRGHYSYHGRVKALAEGAREAGLIF